MATSAEILKLVKYTAAAWPHVPTAPETAEVWVDQLQSYPAEILLESVRKAVAISENWPSVRLVRELAESAWTAQRQAAADRRLRLPEPKADPNDPDVKAARDAMAKLFRRFDVPPPEVPE